MKQTTQKQPTSTERLPILIVGGFGHLGSLITKHCLLNPKLQVSIFVRNPDKNPELASKVESGGGKVFKGDITVPETFKGITKGFHTVISALPSHDEKVSVEGQINLIKDCVENQVKRFVPSDFGLNWTLFSKEETNQFLDAEKKLRVDFYLKSAPIKKLSFRQGFFAEFFFKFQNIGFSYWGDSDHKICITTMEDIAKVVAEAVGREDLTGEIVFVGNELSIEEISKLYNQTRENKTVPKRLGSMEYLQSIHDMKKQKSGDMGLGFSLILYDQRSRFQEKNNDMFPDIKPTTIEEFLKQNPDVKVGVDFPRQKLKTQKSEEVRGKFANLNVGGLG